MSSSRLYVLSLLARHGPMHGHQMRLTAQEERLDLWTDVQAGALYGVLKRLAADGLITARASERAGNYPERTVYEMTPGGRQALRTLHDQALRKVAVRPDPFDLALATAQDTPEPRLRDTVSDRRDELAALAASTRHQREFAEEYLSEAERKVMDHLVARLDAEVRWHDDVLADLPEIVADFARRATLALEDQ